MHYESQTGIGFYLVVFMIGLVLFLGLFSMVRVWRLGKTRRPDARIQVPRFISSLLKAGVLQTQILEYSVLAWLSHMMMFWGFVALALLTTLHFLLSWFVPASSSLLTSFKEGGGILVLAVWGDFWGVVLLAGILLALFRRFILKPMQLRTMEEDSVTIGLLLAVTLTGFLCEAARLAAHPEAGDYAYSFAVNWAASFLVDDGWGEGHVKVLFWVHTVVSLLFLAYIPFGKLRHMFSSPLVHALNGSSSHYTKTSPLIRRFNPDGSA